MMRKMSHQQGDILSIENSGLLEQSLKNVLQNGCYNAPHRHSVKFLYETFLLMSNLLNAAFT